MAAIEEWQPEVIIGSSRGGAIMMGVRTETPVMLVAPAWRFFGVEPVVRCSNVAILHSESDGAVALADSLVLASSSPHVKLIVAGYTHSLTCRSGSQAILNELGHLLELGRRFQ